jgi:serine protease
MRHPVNLNRRMFRNIDHTVNSRRALSVWSGIVLAALLWPGFLASMTFAEASIGAPHEFNPVLRQPRGASEPSGRFLIGLKDTELSSLGAEPTALSRRLETIAQQVRVPLRVVGSIGATIQVAELLAPATPANVQMSLAALRKDPAVVFAEPDQKRYPHAVTPNDPFFSGQWYLRGAQASAVRADLAWDASEGSNATGSNGMVVAVLDTGIRFDHPDLARAADGGRLLPGYDFVRADRDGSFVSANDGDGRDADPSDPGDWITEDEANLPIFGDSCEAQDSSSWHGTRVAGIIGARSNNGVGITGTSWSPWILPVRVLGKCGGYDSDILAGMRWAGGLSEAGVPDNPYPARILNLSLGSEGACSASYAAVSRELAEAGVVVISSAGNEGSDVSTPANCPGVIAVVALRHAGTKVGFSNLGATATLGAPGGNCVNVGVGEPCLYSIDTTSDRGQTRPVGPAYTDQFNINVGTSFSAPIVAGVAALMLSANGRLDPLEVTRRLRTGTRAYPPAPAGVPLCRDPASVSGAQDRECACTAEWCGAGMLDALGAVREARRPMMVLAPVSGVTVGQNIRLDARESSAACGRTLSGFAWRVIAAGGGGSLVSGASSPEATVLVPSSGVLELELAITDSAGQSEQRRIRVSTSAVTTDIARQTIGAACPVAINAGPAPPPPAPAPTPAPTPAPSPSSSSSGGGGSLNILTGLVLLLVAVLRHRRRRGAA